MTLKKQTPVLALPFSVAEHVHRVQMHLLWGGAPSEILASVTEFAFRNVLEGEACCLRCLKAHLLKKLEEEDSLTFTSLIHKILPEEAGHHGYYLDAGDLRKL